MPKQINTSAKPLIITLVHGTFARETSWVQPDSALRTHLENNCSRTPEFRLFRWDGKNDYGSRLDAANDLSKHLDCIATEYPGTEQWIIAHSHGGNIALLAMQKNLQRQNIAGIICLATPFFHLVPRKGLLAIPQILRLIAHFVAVSFTLFITAWLVDNTFRQTSTLGMPKNIGELLIWVYILIGVLCFIAFDFIFAKKVIDRFGKLAAFRAKDFAFSVQTSSHIYCINANFDEVRAGFKLAHYLSLISTMLSSWRGLIAAYFLIFAALIPAGNEAIFAINKYGGFVALTINIYVLYPMILLTDQYIPNKNIDVSIPLVVAFMALITIVTFSLLSTAFAICIHYIATIARFGWAWRWRLFDTILFDIDVRGRPSDLVNAEHLDFYVSSDKLAHTNIYNEANVLQAIARIIESLSTSR